jgi:quercetin dioxygenase-like cupin family protein
MKRLVLVLALLFSASLLAQAPEPVPLAHGNTPGEPHHHLKIENEYVRVYYVEVPPHENTQLHQHDHDYLFVTLGDSEVINAVRDKPEVHLVLKDGETHFTRGGFSHVARNLSDKPFRNVTIELTEPQGEAKNVCARIFLGAPEGKCPRSQSSTGGIHREPLLETEKTSLDLVRLDPSLNVLSIHPQPGTLIVFLGETQIQGESIGAPAEKVVEGDVFWIPVGSGEMIWNSKRKDLSFLQLTFGAAGPKP